MNNLNSYDRFVIFMAMLMYLNLLVNPEDIDFENLKCRKCELREYEMIDNLIDDHLIDEVD